MNGSCVEVRHSAKCLVSVFVSCVSEKNTIAPRLPSTFVRIIHYSYNSKPFFVRNVTGCKPTNPLTMKFGVRLRSQ